MRTYMHSTANRNVPKGAFLIAETSAMSGEIVTTYYADDQGRLWGVGDWKSDKPYPVFLSTVCQLTGDTENILTGRIQSFFRRET